MKYATSELKNSIKHKKKKKKSFETMLVQSFHFLPELSVD